MKNPLAMMAIIAAGLGGIFSGKAPNGWELRRDPHETPKRRAGHNEGICKGASYNKAMLRCQARSRKPDWGIPT
jgi:hypothetical protein